MAELKGTQVAAAIVPFTDLDTYATHDAEYGKGGFRSVDTNAKRDAIPAARKVKGMVVRVNDTGLHWTWTGSAWVEWLPKGSMVVDAALSTTSQNPVQNKVITNQLNALAGIINGIPIITVDTVWNATSNNPASSKAIESTISPIRTTANAANSKADSALGTANAAIPKSYIDDTMPENPVATRVPSTKLLGTVSAVANTAKSTADSAMTKANSASSVANAAIPKSWIDSSIAGNETSNDSVPGTGAIVTYINTSVTNVSTKLNTTNSRVTNIESWKSNIGNKNVANGVAGLDASGKISASQLPAGYDNVDKLVAFVANAPTSGMTIGQKWYITSTKKIFTATSATSGSSSTPIGNDMIYIDQNANKSYYWSGTDMVNIGSGNALALGLTHSTAFYGDYGNTLYTNFGTGTNLTGTQDARDCFAKLKRDFGSAGNASVIKTLHVNTYSNNIILQDDILYFNGEQNNGDGFEIPSVTTSKAGVMTADMFNTFQEIELATFPLNLNIVPSSNSVFEKGSSYTPTINISVSRKGTNVTSESNINVVGEPTLSGSISSDKQTWTPTKAVTANQKLTVTATYGSQSASKVYCVFFKNKKYWGTSANTSLTNAQVLALEGSTWADNRLMESTNFDCTGGKYPYYVIPANVYNGLQVWVGGLKNTDITVTDMTVTNASGSSQAYKVIRLTNIQTGVLSIEFK